MLYYSQFDVFVTWQKLFPRDVVTLGADDDSSAFASARRCRLVCLIRTCENPLFTFHPSPLQPPVFRDYARRHDRAGP